MGRATLVLLVFIALNHGFLAAGAQEVKTAEELTRELQIPERGFEIVPSRELSDSKRNAKGSVDLHIQFELNSAHLTNHGMSALDQLATALASEALLESAFALTGHTDASGSAEYNLILSFKRAEAVKRYLTDTHGLDEDRFFANGRGEMDLLDPRMPTAARNRRVEVKNNGPA